MSSRFYLFIIGAIVMFSGEGTFSQQGVPTNGMVIDTSKEYISIQWDTSYRKFIPSKKVVFDSADEQRFRDIVDRALNKRYHDLDIGDRVRKVGELLLGTPYIDKTLEVDSSRETLVCNLRGLDCVTFYENTLAIARILVSRDKSFEMLQDELMRMRYRDGRLVNFASRLHYTSDYFYDDARRGILREMTKVIGGKKAILETKAINFMSTHPAAYMQLAGDAAMRSEIELAENKINARGGFYYIKKEDVASIENAIRDGDIIGITVSIPGLDCSHTGIAVRGEDGRIHLMHASSAMKKVIISEQPLADYLAGNSKQTGILIYRPTEPRY